MAHDFFEQKASNYDAGEKRVQNVDNIANAILEKIAFRESMHIADFGSGTGLLLERIAPWVDKISAIDVSRAMNKVLESKSSELPCTLAIYEVDITQEELELNVDGLVSSMSLHHVENIPLLLKRFYQLIKPEGFIALADLCLEDGSFHTENTGVHHHGFSPELLSKQVSDAGFQKVRVFEASVAEKPQGAFPVFLITADKLE